MIDSKFLLVLLFIILILNPDLGVSQERIIKPGDAIEIKVYEHKDLDQTVVVSPEGTINFPFLQGIPIDGMTLGRFQEILIAQLSRFMDRRPLISVRFTDMYPIKVTVLGQVAHPGMYAVANTATLQGAIAAAGGFIPGARLAEVKIIRQKNGQKIHQVVNLENFYIKGDPDYLPLLEDGDTIMVTGNPLETTVKVLGSVLRPGSFQTNLRATLMDVIYLAGGPTKSANMGKIKLIKPAAKATKAIEIDLNNSLTAGTTENLPLVEPGDIIYVPEKWLTWSKIMSFMRDVLTVSSIYIIFRWGRRV